jgi:Endonuclease/Exonuclease/phosphatase family
MAARGWQYRAMRYEPSQRLLRLARHLAASRAGLTLDEMAAELEVGLRTAERLRDSLAAMFPQMECWDDDERVRRWRLPGSALVGVVEPRPEAVAAIEISVRVRKSRRGRPRGVAAGGVDHVEGCDAVFAPRRTGYRRADGGRGHRNAAGAAAGDRGGCAADLAPGDPRHAARGRPVRRQRRGEAGCTHPLPLRHPLWRARVAGYACGRAAEMRLWRLEATAKRPDASMRIATYNVNGVNGRLPNLLAWLEEAAPDVVCLQELKAPDEKFPAEAIRAAGYGAIWHGQKSWNGVAILARGAAPTEIRRGLPGDPDDTHSRFIEATIDGMIVGCLYLPNGNAMGR